MNVFVLNAGRCGSLTVAKACHHITNYTSAHQSRIKVVGNERLNYPDNHIEVDNRLSWFLGRLSAKYGKDAFYVHLTRDAEATALSRSRRYSSGILDGYRRGILMGAGGFRAFPPITIARDYVETVTSNITAFLEDKPLKMDFRLESGKEDFRRLWDLVGAQGNLDAALGEFDIAHNATSTLKRRPLVRRLVKKFKRIVNSLPAFVRNA